MAPWDKVRDERHIFETTNLDMIAKESFHLHNFIYFSVSINIRQNCEFSLGFFISFFLYCLPTAVISLLVPPIFTARATYIYCFLPIPLLEYLFGKGTQDIEFIFIYLFVCLFTETVSLCTYYSSVPIAVINTMTQRNLGQARVYVIL